MPDANHFKYFLSYNNLSGVTLGTGGEGIPVVGIPTQDVTGYFKYNALTAQEACNVYWNLAGINGNTKSKVPIVSVTNDDPPPDIIENTFGEEITQIGDLLLSNNSDGEGFQPEERGVAFPVTNFQEQLENNFNESPNEPWPWFLKVQRYVATIGSIRAMEANGIFLGYGFANLAFTYAEGNGQTTNLVFDGNKKSYTISSWFETDDTGDAEVPTGYTGDWDIDYNLVNFAGANFWQREEDKDILKDSSYPNEYPSYGFTVTADAPSAVMFTYP